MPVDTETAFLAARRDAHCAQLDITRFNHSCYCDCGKRPTHCEWCDRGDFECPEDALVFTGTSWVCAIDCIDEFNAENESSPAIAAE